jgi:hypothetical protein
VTGGYARSCRAYELMAGRRCLSDKLLLAYKLLGYKVLGYKVLAVRVAGVALG